MSDVPDLTRVSVVGPSCSGKTTVARSLSRQLDLPHVQLDALHWGPDWTAAEPHAFRASVSEAAAGERWVIDGNYPRARPIVWARATAVVWLDLPFLLVWKRSLIRTTCRIARREELFNGNHETFRNGFLSFNGIPWWVVRSFRSVRRTHEQLLAAPEQAHLDAVRLRTPDEAYRFLTAARR